MQELLNITGIIIGYTSWDDLDANHERMTEALKEFPALTILKAYNQAVDTNPCLEYPWSLALIVKDAGTLNVLYEFIVKKKISYGAERHKVYVGKPRVNDFFRMMLIGKYPPGILNIRFDRCPCKSILLNACMLCPFGHMLECHYPNTCEEANCSHYQREMEAME